MSKFHLENIKRTIFVIIGEKLFLSIPNQKISHKDWFIKEKWMNSDDKSFIENHPRGYIDSEGIYIYQGYKAHSPKISKKLLEKTVKELCLKKNLNEKLHVFLGTVDSQKSKNGKKPPEHDLGPISCVFKKTEDLQKVL